ncbi:hypothetical protein N7517_003600 [Penicillium concentricum]|uniref:Uncharacterized protein n=1 Tax=Penicillium concentricum TaxID=293559 RepID=A0A9W9S5Z5_9EURO|nr:uncharacterized protein N7517_003600 [Penicillium concentricum]KAJ5371594.1 hypothetical protein N7517_003600 [Penicillium concentricum]
MGGGPKGPTGGKHGRSGGSLGTKAIVIESIAPWVDIDRKCDRTQTDNHTQLHIIREDSTSTAGPEEKNGNQIMGTPMVYLLLTESPPGYHLPPHLEEPGSMGRLFDALKSKSRTRKRECGWNDVVP